MKVYDIRGHLFQIFINDKVKEAKEELQDDEEEEESLKRPSSNKKEDY